MPYYDVECPSCGTYERFALIGLRHAPCEKCGCVVEVLITSSGPSKGFEPYFNDGLGIYVTGKGDINKAMRENNADYRPRPTKGDIAERRDRIEQRKVIAAGSRR